MATQGPPWLRDALRKSSATHGEWIHRGVWQQLHDSGDIQRVLNGELGLEGLVAARSEPPWEHSCYICRHGPFFRITLNICAPRRTERSTPLAETHLVSPACGHRMKRTGHDGGC